MLPNPNTHPSCVTLHFFVILPSLITLPLCVTLSVSVTLPTCVPFPPVCGYVLTSHVFPFLHMCDCLICAALPHVHDAPICVPALFSDLPQVFPFLHFCLPYFLTFLRCPPSPECVPALFSDLPRVSPFTRMCACLIF